MATAVLENYFDNNVDIEQTEQDLVATLVQESPVKFNAFEEAQQDQVPSPVQESPIKFNALEETQQDQVISLIQESPAKLIAFDETQDQVASLVEDSPLHSDEPDGESIRMTEFNDSPRQPILPPSPKMDCYYLIRLM